jgi:hypothetical protein
VLQRRSSLAIVLLAAALLAANVTVAVEINRARGWLAAGLVLGVNATLAAFFAVGMGTIRMRLVPLMATFTVTALTEALLWRSATAGRDNRWIAAVAIVGCLMLGAAWAALRTLRR